MILQEYSIRFFGEVHEKLDQLDYKSELHANMRLSRVNFVNFIITYSNLIDCLLKRHGDELKQTNDGKYLPKDNLTQTF